MPVLNETLGPYRVNAFFDQVKGKYSFLKLNSYV